jgi:hypothetical protein
MRDNLFPIIVTSLDWTDNKHGIQRQVRRCRRRRNFIKYFRKAAGILLLGVWLDFLLHLGLHLWCDIALRNPFSQNKSMIVYNYHPCWTVTWRFVSQRKVRSPSAVRLSGPDIVSYIHAEFRWGWRCFRYTLWS